MNIESVCEITAQPEVFARPDSQLASRFLKVLHQYHKLAKETEPIELDTLPELVIDGLDPEQIWAQVELRNQPTVELVKEGLDLLEEDMQETGEGSDDLNQSLADDDSVPEYAFQSEEEGNSENEPDLDPESNDNSAESEAESELDTKNVHDSIGESDPESEEATPMDFDDESAGLERGFFSLKDMENFANQNNADNDDGDAIDYSKDPDDEASDDESEAIGQDAQDVCYRDFFDAPQQQKRRPKREERPELEDDLVDEDQFMGLKKRKRVSFENDPCDSEGFGSDHFDENEEMESGETKQLLDDDEDEDDGEALTSHQKRMKKLQESIADLEKENTAEKQWTLKGESSKKERPVNSLLEEDLEFDYAAKPTPVVTEETTESLEDLIKKRIVDGLWDDVERKLAPSEQAELEARRAARQAGKTDLSDEKPKQSLAEVYEDEYSRQQKAVDDPKAAQRNEALEREHGVLKHMLTDLFRKLDALSHGQYTPHAAHAELTVLGSTNATTEDGIATTTPTATASIDMEEVIPVHVSDAQLLAPHEVYAGPRNMLALKSADERTTEEKRAARQQRKARRRKEQRLRAQERSLLDRMNPGLGHRQAKEQVMKDLVGQSNVTVLGADGKKGKMASSKSDAVSSTGMQLKL